VQGHTIAIGGNTALDPFRKPAINLQREGSLAFRDDSSSPLVACGPRTQRSSPQSSWPNPGREWSDNQAANNRLVVARFGRSRVISQKDFCSVGLRQSQRIIGGDTSDSSKHVFISYYDHGDLVTIPAIWCDVAMGLLTRSEWQRFNAVLTAWAEGKLGVATS